MLSQTKKLVLIVLSAVMFIVIGDTIGKTLTTNGIEPFVVAWTRFLIAAIIILPFCGLRIRELKLLKDFKIIFRAILIAGAIFSITIALKKEPIANVFGAFFIGPIISYFLAAIFLKERPSKTQSLLLAIGFLGVMAVVKPGFGLTTGIAYALLAGIFYGAYLASTKMIAGTYRPRFLLFSQLVIGSMVLTPIGFLNNIELPNLNTNIALLLLGSATFSAAGNFLLVIANRMADASLIAPLIYSQLIFGVFFGYIIFSDIPDPTSSLGLVLIALSGFGSLAIYHKKHSS